MSKLGRIKRIGIKRSVKLAYDRLLTPFIPKYSAVRWKLAMKSKEYMGITKNKRETQLIVSLTTYPARIEGIHHVIKSLLVQTVKPDMLILWLAESQFPNGEVDLPKSLIELKKHGLTISWCNDIRSYKKLIPTVKKYPDAVIITADDDLYYHPKMIERLYSAYKKNPDYIHCHRVSKFIIENDEFNAIPGGYEIYSYPSFLNKLTGGSGSCYPPHSLYSDVCDEELFMSLAPTNDDLWFWLMAVKNGKRCNVVKHSCTALYYVEGSQAESLTSVNDNGEKLFWVQLKNILKKYPEIDFTLREEWEKVSS